jgi:aconitase A
MKMGVRDFLISNMSSSGVNAQGRQVFLKDIWPTRDEIQAVERQHVIPGMFKEVYQKIEVRLTMAHARTGKHLFWVISADLKANRSISYREKYLLLSLTGSVFLVILHPGCTDQFQGMAQASIAVFRSAIAPLFFRHPGMSLC